MKTLNLFLLSIAIFFGSISQANVSETKGEDKKNKFASFPGGDSALACYITSNLNYPQRAIDMNLIGTIHLKFEIDESGKILSAEPDSKLLPEIQDQIQSLISKMPKWNPGVRNGQPFKSKVLVPIQFQLR